ncbi:MAG TPA: ribonuclease HII [Nitrospirales bacterium]|nr:ribonuclease HII [Nitrospirales bacterium]HIB53638.1 ribonuclease HII [Nitrospirales bacterium]HIN32768.1 ribonuclease HII [Nitrospirales bacterium]
MTSLAGVEPDGFFETEAYTRGFRCIAGIDEAGRGPLAGPVVAAAVILSRQKAFPGLKDSKCLSPAKREQLFVQISHSARDVSVGYADAAEIDAIGILPATHNAMRRAVCGLTFKPDCLLIDAVTLPDVHMVQRAIVKGDSLSRSIAAASVVAKVTRDRVMGELHDRYPQYNFRAHKGYGTAEHLRLLDRFGPCDAHRKCFRPIADMTSQRPASTT